MNGKVPIPRDWPAAPSPKERNVTLTRAELCLMLCALSEAVAVTLEAQMSADDSQFQALDRNLDLYFALRRKLRLFEGGPERTDTAAPDADEATDRTAWVGDLAGGTE